MARVSTHDRFVALHSPVAHGLFFAGQSRSTPRCRLHRSTVRRTRASTSTTSSPTIGGVSGLRIPRAVVVDRCPFGFDAGVSGSSVVGTSPGWHRERAAHLSSFFKPPRPFTPAYRALIRPSGEDAMRTPWAEGAFWIPPPRQGDARGSADAHSSADAGLS